MTLKQMEQLAVDLKSRVETLEQRLAPDSIGTVNTTYLTEVTNPEPPEGKKEKEIVTINEANTNFASASIQAEPKTIVMPNSEAMVTLDQIENIPIGEGGGMLVIAAYANAAKLQASRAGIRFALKINQKVIPFHTQAGVTFKTEATLFLDKAPIIVGDVYTRDEVLEHAGLTIQESGEHEIAPVSGIRMAGNPIAVWAPEGVYTVEWTANLQEVPEKPEKEFLVRDHILMVHA